MNFIGIGWLSLRSAGRTYAWEEAFGPIHKKLGITSSKSASAPVAEAEVSPLLNDNKA